MNIDKLRERVEEANAVLADLREKAFHSNNQERQQFITAQTEMFESMPVYFVLISDLLTALEDREAKLTIAREALKKPCKWLDRGVCRTISHGGNDHRYMKEALKRIGEDDE